LRHRKKKRKWTGYKRTKEVEGKRQGKRKHGKAMGIKNTIRKMININKEELERKVGG
jgi:hypothetical protein